MEITEEILGLLQKMDAQKGVPENDDIIDKNIIREDDPTLGKDKGRTKGVLTSKERRKLTSIFELFSRVFLTYKEKNEEPSTLITSLDKEQKKAQKMEERETDGDLPFGKIVAMLAGGVALVAAAIPLLVKALFEEVGPLGSILKTISKTGLMGGLKLIGKAFKSVFKGGLKFLKRIPYIGAIVDFYFAYKEFKAGRIIPGIMEIIIGLTNFIPGVGPFLSIGLDILKVFMDSKGMFDDGGALSNENAWDTIKKWASSIGNFIWENALWIPILGGIKRMGMAKDKFASGDLGGGLTEVIKGLISFTGAAPLVRGYEVLAGFLSGKLSEEPAKITEDTSWSKRMVEWIRSKLKILPWWIKKPLAWFGLIPDDMVGKGPESLSDIKEGAKKGFEKTKQFIGGIWDKVKGPMGDGVEVVKNFAVDTWKNTKDFSAKAWEKTKEIAPKIWNSVKNISKQGLDFVSEIGKKAWPVAKEKFGDAWNLVKKTGEIYFSTIDKINDKASDIISKWAPRVLDKIKGITKNALKVLGSLGKKIGGWIGSLFSGKDDNKEIEKRRNQESVKNIQASEKQANAILKYSDLQSRQLTTLAKASAKQIELLTAILRVETASLQELRKGTPSQNNTTPSNINISASPSQVKDPLQKVGNNRESYLNSPYALPG